ncbi:cytochrome b subunit of formate dehydrogenase [Bacillus atrophaeus]|nr:cytochrome b subunit of formate dehydrogenase [Bacillus atrophaeus]
MIITFLIALTAGIIFYFGKSLSFLLLVIIMFIAVCLVLKINEYITKKETMKIHNEKKALSL